MAQLDLIDRSEFNAQQQQLLALAQEIALLHRLLGGLEWLTVEQAAVILKCSESTVSRLVKSKELPAKRDGKSVRIRLAAVTAYLNNLPNADLAQTDHRLFKGLQWEQVEEYRRGDQYVTKYRVTLPPSPYLPETSRARSWPPMTISTIRKRPLDAPPNPPAPYTAIFSRPTYIRHTPRPLVGAAPVVVNISVPQPAPPKATQPRRGHGGRRSLIIVP